jgi:molybdate transport system regulatory protein
MPETDPTGSQPRLSLRLDFPAGNRLGPGKITLLEAIAVEGSISGAGRRMKMSYRRAWLLVDELNHMFHAALVEAQPGGAKGGGARLSPLGEDIVRHYRAIETMAMVAATPHLLALQGAAARPDHHVTPETGA